MKIAKTRIQWIDVAKGLCIFFVVLGHTMRPGYVRTFVYSFHVPLFFFLSGACFSDKYDIKEYVLKKFKTVMIPYYFFSLVSIAAFAFLERIFPRISDILNCSLFDNLAVMIYANSKPDCMKYNSPLWFLPCLFCVLIIVFAIERFNNNQSKKYTAIVIVVAILLSAILNYNEFAASIRLPFHFETAISMTVWFELGVLVQRTRWFDLKISESSKKTKCLFLGFMVAILAVGFCLAIFNRKLTGTSLQVREDIYGNTLLYYISAFVGIIGWTGISKLLCKVKMLQTLGRDTLSVMVMHKFPVLIFQEIILISRQILDNPNSFLGLLVGIGVSVISIVLSYGCGKIIAFFVPSVLGKSKLKNRTEPN